MTCREKLMIEHPEDVVFGIRVIMKALNVKKGYIAIETNKPDAIEAVKNEEMGIKTKRRMYKARNTFYLYVIYFINLYD